LLLIHRALKFQICGYRKLIYTAKLEEKECRLNLITILAMRSMGVKRLVKSRAEQPK